MAAITEYRRCETLGHFVELQTLYLTPLLSVIKLYVYVTYFVLIIKITIITFRYYNYLYMMCVVICI